MKAACCWGLLVVASLFVVAVQAVPQDVENPGMPPVETKLNKALEACDGDQTLEACFDRVAADILDQKRCARVLGPLEKDGGNYVEVEVCGIESCDEGHRMIEGNPENLFPGCCSSCEKLDEKKHYYETGAEATK